jgi:hypothetical protein
MSTRYRHQKLEIQRLLTNSNLSMLLLKERKEKRSFLAHVEDFNFSIEKHYNFF